MRDLRLHNPVAVTTLHGDGGVSAAMIETEQPDPRLMLTGFTIERHDPKRVIAVDERER